jgi:arylsulfatase A-like enzyme
MEAKKSIVFVSSVVLLIMVTTIAIFLFKKPPEVLLENKEDSLRPTSPNIVVLLLDCVRADHLSCYGYSKKTSPNIDSLASNGILFKNAISQAPWTFPSVFSLLSGQYPHKHGKWLIKKGGISPNQRLKKPSKNILLLSEFLKEIDYHTWGFSTNTYINARIMQERGFDEFHYIWKAPAMEPVNYGIAKIREAEHLKKPFFLYLHFMDAHHPLQPPQKFYNFFPCSDGKNNERRHEGLAFKKHEEQHGRAFQNYREHKISLYDGTIRYMDDEIGRLIRELESSFLPHDTIVIVLADHGDEFWEHAKFEANHYPSLQERQGLSHGHTLFQELIRVPLIITSFNFKGKPPSSKIKQPATIEATVPLVDLVPTLLDLIGHTAPSPFDGASFIQLVKENASSLSKKIQTSKRSIFSELASSKPKIALFEHPYKFIFADEETNTLFNITEDPKELNNLIEEQAVVATAMLKKISRFRESKPPETEELSLSRDDLNKLQILGYIEN